MRFPIKIMLTLMSTFALTACTFNPFTTDNKTTGSGTGAAVGAGIGAGGAALLGAPKPLIAALGLGGAALGYYVTTLSFDSQGVVQAGGQVFTLGDYVTIDIPSDRLFDVNTSEFLDSAAPILQSAAEVLKHYPNNNIVISGNTSGFSTARYERKLSENRARQVASYLWMQGINDFKGATNDMRKLAFVGHGNFFPVANNIRNEGIRQNSHIQITSYPTRVDLQLDNCHKVFDNIGDLGEPPLQCEVSKMDFGKEFSEPLREVSSSRREDFGDVFNESPSMKNTVSPKEPQSADYYRERANLKNEDVFKDYSNIQGTAQTQSAPSTRSKQGSYKGDEL